MPAKTTEPQNIIETAEKYGFVGPGSVPFGPDDIRRTILQLQHILDDPAMWEPNSDKARAAYWRVFNPGVVE